METIKISLTERISNFSLPNIENLTQIISVKKCYSYFRGILFLVGAFVIGSLGAKIAGDILFQPFIGQKVYTPPKMTNTDKSRSVKDYSPVISGNTFDTIPAPEDIFESSQTVGSIQQKIADMRLKGTMVWGKISSAYIQKISLNEEQFFSLDEDVFEAGVKLKEVHDNFIVIELNGATAELHFPVQGKTGEHSTSNLPETPAQNPIPTISMPQPLDRVNAALGKPEILVKNGRADITLSQAKVEQALGADFPIVLQHARVTPKIGENGNLDGFVIKDITKGSFYEDLGLKNLDLIQSVNGETIDSPEKAMQLFKQFRRERQINIKLSRRGELISINYFIQ